MSDRLVVTLTGTVESVVPNPKRPSEDLVRFRPVRNDGTMSAYFEQVACKSGKLTPGNFTLTLMVRSVAWTREGKARSFLSLWLLDAAPVA